MSDAELVQIPLGGGLDETAEDAYVPPTRMRICENVVFPDGNTCTKRKGLLSGASVPFGRKLLKRGGELLITDGAALYGVQGTATTARGRVSPCMVQRAPMAPANLISTSPDFPIVPRGSVGYHAATGYSVRAWSNGLAVAAQVVNEATGAAVTLPMVLNGTAGRADDGQFGAVDNPRVCIVGSAAFVLFADVNAVAHIQYRAIDLTNIAAGWTVQAPLANSFWPGPAWDAETVTGTTTVALLTCSTAGSIVQLSYYSAAGTVLTYILNTNVAAGVAGTFTACAVRGNGTDNVVIVVYASTNGGIASAHYAAYDLTFALIQAPSAVAANAWSGAAGANEGRGYLAVGVERVIGQGAGHTAMWLFTVTQTWQVGRNYGGGKTVDRLIYATFWTTDTTVSGAAQPRQGPVFYHQMVSKPRAVSVAGVTRVYMLVEFAAQQRLPNQQIIESSAPGVFGFGIPDGNQTTLLVELPWSPQLLGAMWYPCATTAVLSAGDLPPASFDMVAGPGSTLLVPGTEVDQAKKTSLSLLTLDFAHPGLWQSVEMGNWAFVAGGMPMIYDGSLACEVGFVSPPPPPLVCIKTTGAGGFTNNPKCQYLVVEVQQDAAGNIHRSAPSNPVQVDASAGGGATDIRLVVFPRRTTLRQAFSQTAGDVGPDPVRIQIYRNTTLTPTVFYLCGEVINDTSVFSDGIDYVETQNDATIATEAQVPTQGGIVESIGPPSLSGLTVHADRVIGIDDDGRSAWFTTQYVPGECPRFSESFTLPWPDGRLTALWSLEQRLHAATADRTYFVIGEGPTDANTGADWTTPQLWNADLGAVDPRGVAVFEKGALVSTKRGLYLEGRDGSWTWVGEKVRRTMATYPVVTAIVPRTTDGAVQIACDASTPTDLGGGTVITQGVVIHWNHRQERWSTHFLSALGLTFGAEGAIEVQGQYCTLTVASFFGTQAGQVNVESAAYLDGAGSVWVTARVVTGWFVLAGMQGSVRVARVLALMQPLTAHGITIATARDRAAAFDTDSGVWTDADIAGMTAEQLRHTPTVQKAQSMSVEIFDTSPTTGALGSGEGPELVSLMLRGRPRRGEWKSLIPTQQR